MQYFVGSVANAHLLVKEQGRLRSIASCRTLTDSNIMIESSNEEIRAGQSSKLYGRFSHSSGIRVELQDAMFDLDYLAYQVGNAVHQGGITTFIDTQAWICPSGFYLTKNPTVMGNFCPLNKVMVWYQNNNCNSNIEYEMEVRYSHEKQLWVPTKKRALDDIFSKDDIPVIFDSDFGFIRRNVENISIIRFNNNFTLSGTFHYPDEVYKSRAIITLGQSYIPSGSYSANFFNISGTTDKDLYLNIRADDGSFEKNSSYFFSLV